MVAATPAAVAVTTAAALLTPKTAMIKELTKQVRGFKRKASEKAWKKSVKHEVEVRCLKQQNRRLKDQLGAAQKLQQGGEAYKAFLTSFLVPLNEEIESILLSLLEAQLTAKMKQSLRVDFSAKRIAFLKDTSSAFNLTALNSIVKLEKKEKFQRGSISTPKQVSKVYRDIEELAKAYLGGAPSTNLPSKHPAPSPQPSILSPQPLASSFQLPAYIIQDRAPCVQRPASSVQRPASSGLQQASNSHSSSSLQPHPEPPSQTAREGLTAVSVDAI
ncbi:hypothetical protein B484DRAFT_477478 [Ochromonadaceae sp. CCMP2298]|nr:hypothetical protein B484DRAFT_477478 [Ochromonadaceae sp. CCMP2298]